MRGGMKSRRTGKQTGRQVFCCRIGCGSNQSRRNTNVHGHAPLFQDVRASTSGGRARERNMEEEEEEKEMRVRVCVMCGGGDDGGRERVTADPSVVVRGDEDRLHGSLPPFVPRKKKHTSPSSMYTFIHSANTAIYGVTPQQSYKSRVQLIAHPHLTHTLPYSVSEGATTTSQAGDTAGQ